jgi:glycosyltransferase involved in cell wall biosynthesis
MNSSTLPNPQPIVIGDAHRVPRVLFVDQSADLGGAELCLLDIASAWPNQCQVVLFDHGPFETVLSERSVDVSVISVGRASRTGRDSKLGGYLQAGPATMRAAFKLANIARNFDLVYANSQKAFIVGALAARIARKPCVWHLHDILTASHFGWAARRIDIYFANSHARQVVASSEASAAAFREAGGDGSKIDVVYNGFHTQHFQRDLSHASAELRRELKCGAAPLIGSFSRLARWKGQHVILDALVHLPETHLLVVGAPLFGEEDYAKELLSRVQELGLSDRVHFWGFRQDIATLMAGVDIVIHSSISPEPFGRVVVEAMLVGRPVIASDAGGMRELITHNENGLLTEPGDVAGLCAAIELLQKNPGRSQEIAQRAQLISRQRFGLDAILDRLQQVCAKAVA